MEKWRWWWLRTWTISLVTPKIKRRSRGSPLSLKESLGDMGDDNYYTGVPTLSEADEPQTTEGGEYILKFPYREAAGALMWTAKMAYPDIACVVRTVARLWENPGLAQDKKPLLKGIQYLIHTNEWGITYGEQGCELSMEASTDSEFWGLPG